MLKFFCRFDYARGLRYIDGATKSHIEHIKNEIHLD